MAPGLKIGDRVRHPEHGPGTVASGCPRPDMVWVEFDRHQDAQWSVGLIEIVPVADLALEAVQ